MAIPASNDTRSKYMVYVEKLSDGVLRLLNNSGAAVAQGDYILYNGFLGVVLQDAADTEYFDMRIDDEIEVQASDLTTGADTFATLYQDVYFNPAAGEFADDPAFGIPVGKLSVVKDANGCIKFFNLAKTIAPGSEPFQVEIEITADATSGKAIDLGLDVKLLDVVLYCTVSNASGTVKLTDGTNDITDAMTAAVVDTRAAAATIDETYNEITVASETLTAVTNGAADRARLILTLKAV